MKTTTPVAEKLKAIFVNPTHDIAGIANDLLLLCRQHDLVMHWQKDGLRVVFDMDSVEEWRELSLSKSAFRALLARLAFLCNEQKQGAVSPYGGEGEFLVESLPAVVFHIKFANTPSVQSLELRSRVNP